MRTFCVGCRFDAVNGAFALMGLRTSRFDATEFPDVLCAGNDTTALLARTRMNECASVLSVQSSLRRRSAMSR